MKKKCKTYIVLVMFFFGTVGQIKAEENIMIKNIARDNTLFALDLYNQLKMTDGNLFFSPFSIFTALAMTWAGARENTAVQMAENAAFHRETRSVSSRYRRSDFTT
jgi:serpin B